MAINLSSFNRFLTTVSSTANRIGSAINTVANVTNAVRNIVQDFSNPSSFMSNIRRGSLPTGAEYTASETVYANWSGSANSIGTDWRVRLHVPKIQSFTNSATLRPLQESGDALVFPTTPQILVTHSAYYNNLSLTHTNYPYPVYQNSAVEDINISGEFPVDNEKDGMYYIAAVHFLRSATKMWYGDSPNRGAPPVVVHLSGYGDFIFNRIPVVVKLFSIDLPDGVDYIKVPFDFESDGNNSSSTSKYSYVPTLSRISVTLQPAYSRDQTRQFNLDKFIQGGYTGQQSGGGFI